LILLLESSHGFDNFSRLLRRSAGVEERQIPLDPLRNVEMNRGLPPAHPQYPAVQNGSMIYTGWVPVLAPLDHQDQSGDLIGPGGPT
jgi:hypothetical protein